LQTIYFALYLKLNIPCELPLSEAARSEAGSVTEAAEVPARSEPTRVAALVS